MSPFCKKALKVSKIITLADDIARNTSSVSARVATIPGKSTIGIEIPNAKRENVFLNEIIADERFYKKEIKLPIALGKSISGARIYDSGAGIIEKCSFHA